MMDMVTWVTCFNHYTSKVFQVCQLQQPIYCEGEHIKQQTPNIHNLVDGLATDQLHIQCTGVSHPLTFCNHVR